MSRREAFKNPSEAVVLAVLKILSNHGGNAAKALRAHATGGGIWYARINALAEHLEAHGMSEALVTRKGPPVTEAANASAALRMSAEEEALAVKTIIGRATPGLGSPSDDAVTSALRESEGDLDIAEAVLATAHLKRVASSERLQALEVLEPLTPPRARRREIMCGEEGDYEVDQLLGEGAFGVVLMATSPTGKRAVIKSPIAASHANEMTHESAVLAILDKCRTAHPNARGHDNLPSLIIPKGGNNSITFDPARHPEYTAQKIRKATSKSSAVMMSYAGQELSNYHIRSVDALRAGELAPGVFLLRVQKIAQDIFAAVHFLSKHASLCHHDIKMFNVAVEPHFSTDSLEQPHATLFDFGTCFPCNFIPDSVYGTNAYHPPEVHYEVLRQAATEQTAKEIQEFYGSHFTNLYQSGDKAMLLYSREEVRVDRPPGACDVFGVGALLAEMLYGIYETIDSGGNWAHLLFPMGDSDAKQAILSRLSGADAQKNLRELMMSRCEFPEVFDAVVDKALAMGAGELILGCLAADPVSRLSADQAATHHFFKGIARTS